MKKDSPLIAITCGSNNELPRGRGLYLAAVEKAGGKALFLSPGENAAELSVRYDGFIIPGGRDLDPKLYKEDVICETIPEERLRSDFEISLLHEIMKRKKPVLGICYGMQLINIFFHGSLYQDLSLQLKESLGHAGGPHSITIGNNPFVESGEWEVNSSHHQAVKKVGTGLKPFALAHDGVIEAIYGDGLPFLVGVQWHPERMPDFLSDRIFERFLEACRV